MSEHLVLLSALVFGLAHAVDLDHLAAVTAFASKDPSPSRAMKFGMWWGVGHSLSIFLAGSVILTLKLTITPALSGAAELTAAVALMVLGVWLAKDLISSRVHFHKHPHRGRLHAHFHSHKIAGGHSHRHAPTIVGMLQGLAGTAAVLALIPLTLIETMPLALLYLLLFGASTVLAIAVWGLSLGYIFGPISTKSDKIYRALRALVCAVSFGTGFAIVAGAI